jgi:enoyl-CoA hydratase
VTEHRDADFEAITFERDGDVLIATIDVPGDDLNRVDGRLHDELVGLAARLRSEEDARAILLAANGRAFSAGGDFRWFPELQDGALLPRLHHDGRQIVWDLLDVRQPIVAAVQGPAVGLGASIALLCDAVFLGESASLADPHVRVGLVAGDGGTIAWPLALGPAAAKRWLLTGDALDAHAAVRLGLATEVVADADLRATALAFARRLASLPPLAVQGTKQAVNQWMRQVMTASFDLATALEMVTFHSTDHVEALDAIREKREPRYRGR